MYKWLKIWPNTCIIGWSEYKFMFLYENKTKMISQLSIVLTVKYWFFKSVDRFVYTKYVTFHNTLKASIWRVFLFLIHKFQQAQWYLVFTFW